MTRLVMWLLGCLLFAQAVHGHTERVVSLTVTNATGYLLAGDGSIKDPAFNRANIAARAEILFTATNSLSPLTYSYYVEFELLNAANEPVAVFDAKGQSNRVYQLSDSVSLPAGAPPFAVVKQVTRTYDAPLVPVGRLDPLDRYRVHLRLRKRGLLDPKYVEIQAGATDVARTYYHFTNARSGDAAWNVIALLEGAAYQRTYLVRTVPGRDSFEVRASFTLRRYDDFAAAPAASEIPLRFTYEVRDATTGTSVALVRSNQAAPRTLLSHGISLANAPAWPTTLTSTQVLEI
ncbi:MAG: hypothetical protein JNK85_16650, partial [Verrucomicrobiales bacterium]|nr:hypothetical protein [Verrucomicrobiales bacterium]